MLWGDRTPVPAPPSTDPADRWVDLAERLLVCGRIFRDALREQLARCQLTEPEFSMLWAAAGAPDCGLGQKELAARLAVSQAQVSGLVEQLGRRGLLEGRRGEQDRRRQLWRLTDRGRATLEAVSARLAPWARQLDQSAGADLPGVLRELLERLVGAVAGVRENRSPVSGAVSPCQGSAAPVWEEARPDQAAPPLQRRGAA